MVFKKISPSEHRGFYFFVFQIFFQYIYYYDLIVFISHDITFLFQPFSFQILVIFFSPFPPLMTWIPGPPGVSSKLSFFRFSWSRPVWIRRHTMVCISVNFLLRNCRTFIHKFAFTHWLLLPNTFFFLFASQNFSLSFGLLPEVSVAIVPTLSPYGRFQFSVLVLLIIVCGFRSLKSNSKC